jgi:Tfp pilus assembly protein PilO
VSLEEKLVHISTGRAAIIGLFIAGLYYIGMYDDGAAIEKKIEEQKLSIQQSTAELNRIKRAIEDSKRYKKVAEELGERMGSILRYIPEELRASDLMKRLSNEAKATGSNIMSVKDQGIVKEGFFEKVGVDLRIEANFGQILLFLSYLTRVDKIITLESFSITGGKMEFNELEVGEKPQLNFSGKFLGYRFVPEGKGDKK